MDIYNLCSNIGNDCTFLMYADCIHGTRSGNSGLTVAAFS